MHAVLPWAVTDDDRSAPRTATHGCCRAVPRQTGLTHLVVRTGSSRVAAVAPDVETGSKGTQLSAAALAT